MNQVRILVDDDHRGVDHRRYKKGDVAIVLEHKSRLASGRWWHYRVRLKNPCKTPEGRGLSTITYFKNNEVEPI